MWTYSDLPDEVVRHIFSYVTSRHALARCRLVCRTWRRVINNDVDHLHLAYPCDVSLLRLEHFGFVGKVSLGPPVWRPDNSKHIFRHLARLPKLRSLTLECDPSCTVIVIPEEVALCQQLRKLSIGTKSDAKGPLKPEPATGHPPYTLFWPDSFSQLKKLRILKIVNIRYGVDACPVLHQVQELKLKGAVDVTQAARRLVSARKLKRLSLEGCVGVRHVMPILSKLESLRWLKASCSPFQHVPYDVSFMGEDVNIAALTSLTYLDLQHNPSFSHHQVASLSNLNRLVSLNLSGVVLVVVPPELSTLTTLQQLCLADCMLSLLPAWMATFTLLKVLRLESNSLVSLPTGLLAAPSLETLTVSHNQLTTLGSVGPSTSLQKLDLASNCLSELPDSISSLQALEWLLLSGNQFRMVPPSLSLIPKLRFLTARGGLPYECSAFKSCLQTISKCRHLTYLDLAGNYVPDSALLSCLANLQHLRHLVLSDAGLSVLPDTLAPLKKLEVLDLSLNQLQAVPEVLHSLVSLERLNLQYNRLVKLPVWIANLRMLRYLNVSWQKAADATIKVQYLYSWCNDLPPGLLSMPNLRRFILTLRPVCFSSVLQQLKLKGVIITNQGPPTTPALGVRKVSAFLHGLGVSKSLAVVSHAKLRFVLILLVAVAICSVFIYV